DARPRAPLEPGPGAEPGAEDHHAFEADVDDPRALGPQTAESGEADRNGECQRTADLADGGDVVGAADDADQRDQGETARDDQQDDGQGELAAAVALLGGGACGDGFAGAHRAASFSVVRACPAASSS